MNQSEIGSRAREMREEWPDMFTHPELKEGEVCINDGVVCDAATAQAAVYRSIGLTSARLGKAFLGKLKGSEQDFQFYPIFADLNELIIAEDADKRKKKKKKKKKKGAA